MPFHQAVKVLAFEASMRWFKSNKGNYADVAKLEYAIGLGPIEFSSCRFDPCHQHYPVMGSTCATEWIGANQSGSS